MSTDPDQIRADIERTRAELSSDVDALSDKVSPSQVARRQADRLRTAASDLKDTVMGGVEGAAGTASSTASSLGEAATDLPHTAKDKTRGNPLAAGLVAFGAGWLISSLLPSTRQERDLARSAKEQAAPLVQEVKEAAQDVAEHLREPTQDATTAVTERVAEAGSTLRDGGRAAAHDLRGQAGDAADAVKGAHVAEGVQRPGP